MTVITMKIQRLGLLNLFLICFLALALFPASASSEMLKDLDLSGNGNVDIGDAVAALQISSGTETGTLARSVCSSPVGLKKAVCILQVLAYDETDAYECDDTFHQANFIGLEEVQYHNFHDAGDTDWVIFYGKKDEPYTIEIREPGENCNPTIELHVISADGQLELLSSVTGRLPGLMQTLNWGNADDWEDVEEGLFFAKITNTDASVFGQGTGYDLSAHINDAPPSLGAIVGFVCDAAAILTEPVQMVMVTIRETGDEEERPVYYNDFLGIYYAFGLRAGTYVLTVSAEGYAETFFEKEVISLLVREDVCLNTLSVPRQSKALRFGVRTR